LSGCGIPTQEIRITSLGPPVECLILTKPGFFDRLLQKTPMFIFTKICKLEVELIQSGRRTDGWRTDMTRLWSAFRD